MNGEWSKSVARQTRRAVLTAMAMASLCLSTLLPLWLRRAKITCGIRPAPRYSAPRQQSRPTFTRRAVTGAAESGRPFCTAVSESDSAISESDSAISEPCAASVSTLSSTGRPTGAASDTEPVCPAAGRSRCLSKFELQCAGEWASGLPRYSQAAVCATGASWRVAEYTSQRSRAATAADAEE